MRKGLRERLIARFAERIVDELPGFEPIESDFAGPYYRKSLGGGIMGYLQLVIPDDANAYTIEAGWSLNDQVPKSNRQHGYYPFGDPEEGVEPDEPVDGGLVYRIGALARTDDLWWNVITATNGVYDDDPPRGKPKLPPRGRDALEVCLDDTLQRIRDYVLPYFEWVVEKYGRA